MDDKDKEINRLRSILEGICNWPLPEETQILNIPKGAPELVHMYKIGFSNGWVQYRQTIKKFIYPGGG